jgi:sterol desaturase/sphingolipid hydroxylase (fatty acid hydroxylase superfamily)
MLDLAKYVINLPQFLITWSIFFGAGIIFYILYALRKGHRFAFRELYEHCVPFDVFRDKSFHGDLKIYFIGKLTDGILFIPTIALNAWLCLVFSNYLKAAFPGHSPVEFTILYASICTVAMFFVAEFSDYLCHYTEHKVPFLWELHKVHHSALSLNPLTSKRGHPAAMFFEGVVRSSLTGLLGGFFVSYYGITVVEATSLSFVATKIFIIATLDPLKHSHHPISLGPFDRFLISPHMHQIHHSKTQAHWDKNFGTNLSVFDWIMGTAYKPAPDEKAVYGISGLSDDTLRKYNTLYGAYISPLVKSYKKLFNRNKKNAVNTNQREPQALRIGPLPGEKPNTTI